MPTIGLAVQRAGRVGTIATNTQRPTHGEGRAWAAAAMAAWAAAAVTATAARGARVPAGAGRKASAVRDCKGNQAAWRLP